MWSSMRSLIFTFHSVRSKCGIARLLRFLIDVATDGNKTSHLHRPSWVERDRIRLLLRRVIIGAIVLLVINQPGRIWSLMGGSSHASEESMYMTGAWVLWWEILVVCTVVRDIFYE